MRLSHLAPFARFVILWVVSAAIYAWVAGPTLMRPSLAPYYSALADALLRGQLYIENPPSNGYDMIYYGEKWYVAQQPAPSAFFMPVVAVLGRRQVPDNLIGILIGAFSVALCDAILGRRERRPLPRLLLTALFGFGTVHASLSVMGTVWFLGHTVAVLFTWGTVALTWVRLPLWAGVAAGGVLLSRAAIAPSLVFFVLGYGFLAERGLTRRLVREGALFVIGFGVMAGVLGLYNAARFGSPLEFGYNDVQDAANIRERRKAYGLFSPAFFGENAYIAFLKPIELRPQCLTDPTCSLINTDLNGAGLIWISPALLFGVLAFFPFRREAVLLLATAVLGLLPGLFYHNNGSAQFGYRFLHDALPFLMVLVMLGIERRRVWLFGALVAVSAAVNVWGAVWLVRTLG
jgi:hypothetical protein